MILFLLYSSIKKCAAGAYVKLPAAVFNNSQQQPWFLLPHTHDITAIITIAQRIVQRSIPQIDGLQHDSFWQHSITERLLSHFVMYTMIKLRNVRLSALNFIVFF